MSEVPPPATGPALRSAALGAVGRLRAITHAPGAMPATDLPEEAVP